MEQEKEKESEKPLAKALDKSIFGKGQLEELLSQFSKQLTEKKENFLASIEEAEEHKERLQKEINTMEVIQAQWGKVVFLNVGGRHFDVSLSTLTQQHPHSMLAVMFSGRHEVVKEARDDRVFIDRDPDAFKHVLSFLRLGEKWVLPEDGFLVKRLKVEFDFFDLPFPGAEGFEGGGTNRTATKTEERIVKSELGGFVGGGTLVTEEHSKIISQWIQSSFTGARKDQQWTLLYKATRDGFMAADFHRLCDAKGPTVVVVRSDSGYIFGGFSPDNWNSPSGRGETVHSPSAFLFTLINPHNIPPTKLAANPSIRNHLFSHPSTGPTFGGHDLCVSSGHSKTGTYGLTEFPNAFIDTTGKGNLLFARSYSFEIDEVEVYAQPMTSDSVFNFLPAAAPSAAKPGGFFAPFNQ